jgi:ABC-2 type transport system ATP-binding protein
VADVIQVRNVRKRYRRRDPWAVDDVSFTVPAGHAFGLLGPNGAGKSSIVKMLTGLSRPDSGSVAAFGGSPQDPAVRARIGFGPEDPDFPKYLRADEVLDYFGRLLGLSASERWRRIPEVLKWCSLADERRQVRQFSKGMKQRLGLAQAILGSPELLILDEPTADLDPVAAELVGAALEELRPMRTVLVIAHRPELAAQADRVVVLAGGRAAEPAVRSVAA